MKIRFIALLLLISCTTSLIKTNPTIVLSNDYSRSVHVYLNNHYIRTLKKGERLQLGNEQPSVITIRAEGSPVYHRGIQDEIETVRYKAQENPNLYATIIIRNTYNPLHFKYTTITEPQHPTTLPPGQSTRSNAQTTVYLQNDTPELLSINSIRTNGTTTSQLIASHDGIILYQTGQPGFANITATGHISRNTINLLPQVSQCLQEVQRYTSGTHERAIHIRNDRIVIQNLSDE